MYSEEQEEIAIKESVEDELEELSVNIEGTEDEAVLNEFDNIGDDVLEEEVDSDDFDLNELSDDIESNVELDDNLDENMFADADDTEDTEDIEDGFEDEDF